MGEFKIINMKSQGSNSLLFECNGKKYSIHLNNKTIDDEVLKLRNERCFPDSYLIDARYLNESDYEYYICENRDKWEEDDEDNN